MKRSLMFRMEEALLIILILLNFAEFFSILPGDLDFIKKIVSWSTLGYLLYSASITRVFLGDRHRGIDIGLIFAYFLLFLKDIIALAVEGGANVLAALYAFMASNGILIEKVGFITGGVLIILFSIYLTFNLHVRKPSIMHVLHEQGIPKTMRKKVERFLILFVVFTAFFILVFNLMMEWLAIAVDASLVVFTLLFFFIAVLRKHTHRFDVGSVIFKVMEGSEKFYAKFIALFHSKKRIGLGFSGLLVLHLLTDTAVFIVPYLLIFTESPLYLAPGTRLGLSAWYLADIAGKTLLDQAAITFVYILNVVAMLFFLLVPGYIWWKVYRRAGFKLTHGELSLFFASLVVFVLSPLFRISGISIEGLVGVDIISHAIDPAIGVGTIVLLSLATAVIVYLLSYLLKEILLIISLVILAAFFTIYVYNFFTSFSSYYLQSISSLWAGQNYFILFYFALFLIITSLFYAGGWAIFLMEARREYKFIK